VTDGDFTAILTCYRRQADGGRKLPGAAERKGDGIHASRTSRTHHGATGPNGNCVRSRCVTGVAGAPPPPDETNCAVHGNVSGIVTLSGCVIVGGLSHVKASGSASDFTTQGVLTWTGKTGKHGAETGQNTIQETSVTSGYSFCKHKSTGYIYNGQVTAVTGYGYQPGTLVGGTVCVNPRSKIVTAQSSMDFDWQNSGGPPP
jgi:hypothetical protein